MPWKESCLMDERMKFISRYLDGEKVTDLCHEFEISRKTAYKFIERFKTHGLYGLDDSKRALDQFPTRRVILLKILYSSFVKCVLPGGQRS